MLRQSRCCLHVHVSTTRQTPIHVRTSFRASATFTLPPPCGLQCSAARPIPQIPVAYVPEPARSSLFELLGSICTSVAVCASIVRYGAVPRCGAVYVPACIASARPGRGDVQIKAAAALVFLCRSLIWLLVRRDRVDELFDGPCTYLAWRRTRRRMRSPRGGKEAMTILKSLTGEASVDAPYNIHSHHYQLIHSPSYVFKATLYFDVVSSASDPENGSVPA